MRSRVAGVTVSIADMRAPPAPRNDVGTPGKAFDAATEARGKAPPEMMLGRVLAIARAGVLPERISLGVQLLLSSVQRRRQVVGASGRRIVTYDETPDERAWFVPSYHLTDLQHPWRRIRKTAGLADVRIHDLRHTFASGGLIVGEGLAMIGKLLGHTQVQTTARYAHLASDPVKQAATKISDRLALALSGAFDKPIVKRAQHIRGRG